MLIEIHMIQNHSPANLNRDDIGAPKTCYFGGVLRSRISSQCIKRSIRLSDTFKQLCGGIRTRRLPDLLIEKLDNDDARERIKTLALRVLKGCGIASKNASSSDTLVYTTYEAIDEMARLLCEEGAAEDELVEQFKDIISHKVQVPDMALTGRMLETGKIDDTTVEASLQTAHAFSTHEAHPEIDYYVAADDVKVKEDHGAGFVGEAMFASACFYKYFSIHWEGLVDNLNGDEKLAAHTVGAFLNAAATVTPSGKQNSYAANNYPDGILVEVREKGTPISYANAFAEPVSRESKRSIVEQSIAQLAQHVNDLDVGYGLGADSKRFWFSPNNRYPLKIVADKSESEVTANNINSLDETLNAVVSELGHNWDDVQNHIVRGEVVS